MPTVNERVTRAITLSGHTPSSVARALGISPEAVLQWMHGPTKNLRNDNLFGLADVTGFSARWIGTGIGPEIETYRRADIQRALRVMEQLPEGDMATLSRMIELYGIAVSADMPRITQ